MKILIFHIIISIGFVGLGQEQTNKYKNRALDSLFQSSQKQSDSIEKLKILDSLKWNREQIEEQQNYQKFKQKRKDFFSKDKFEAPVTPIKLLQIEEPISLEKTINATTSFYSQATQEKSLMAEIIEEEIESNTISNAFRLRGPSIYDSRVEVRVLDPDIDWQRQILTNSNSVGIIIEKEKISKFSSDFYQIDISTSLGKLYNLCAKVPFKNQPTIGVGTAFISAHNQMVTAKHVFQRNLDNYVVVFGYELLKINGIVEAVIHEKDVYFPTAKVYNSDYYDVTIFETDRIIKRPILSWQASKVFPEKTEVYMIGHPSGIPKKIALNASIIDNRMSQFFYTSLDSFQGNSGSPVFDKDTHKVIGVLVSGELDYNFNGQCNEINICKLPYCKGEKVIRIENILTKE